jgi:O-acetylhomoserine/O-acetylserine sulfhydrylase-like pyridoxal-dependent enzyme
MPRKTRRPETAAVHGAADLEKKNGPVGTPIYQTSTFEVTDNDEQQRVTTTDRYYTRWGNPTNTVAEQAVAAIEGTARARSLPAWARSPPRSWRFSKPAITLSRSATSTAGS